MTFLFDRALLLAKIETTFDTDASPDQANDALLVAEPDFVPDITQLDRDNVRTSLSPDPAVVGRTLAQVTFRHEIRNNGNTTGATAPLIGRLLRACGFSETQITTLSQQVSTEAGASNTGEISFIEGTTHNAGTMIRRFKVTIVTGGGSGVAVANIHAPAEGGLLEVNMTDTDEVVLTDGVEIGVHDTAGTTVAYFAPNFQSDNPATGDVYWVTITPRGVLYQPISENFPSLTLYLYLPDDTGQSILHKVTGARGTFTVEAVGGNFGTFSFTFTGSYVAPADAAFPSSPTYETQQPAQVEQAALSVFSEDDEEERLTSLCASQFGIDIGNDIQPRECINESQSYKGSIIVGRAPTLTFDPEVVLEATHPFWAKLAAADELEFNALVGRTKGNVVQFRGLNVQYRNLGYANRNGLRVYNVEATMATKSGDGDDELQIWFG